MTPIRSASLSIARPPTRSMDRPSLSPTSPTKDSSSPWPISSLPIPHRIARRAWKLWNDSRPIRRGSGRTMLGRDDSGSREGGPGILGRQTAERGCPRERRAHRSPCIGSPGKPRRGRTGCSACGTPSPRSKCKKARITSRTPTISHRPSPSRSSASSPRSPSRRSFHPGRHRQGIGSCRSGRFMGGILLPRRLGIGARAFIEGRAAFEVGRYHRAEESFGIVRSIARVYGQGEASRRAEIWTGHAAAFRGDAARARRILLRFGDDAEALWFLAELEVWEGAPKRPWTWRREPWPWRLVGASPRRRLRLDFGLRLDRGPFGRILLRAHLSMRSDRGIFGILRRHVGSRSTGNRERRATGISRQGG